MRLVETLRELVAFDTQNPMGDERPLGPGRIEQAHAADEYVELEQLERARAAFVRALGAC